MKLYKWQTECLRAWEANHFRGIVHVITGAGKTILALTAMDEFLSRHPEGRIRIVVPTIPLAQQWETAILHYLNSRNIRPGFFGGGSRDNSDTPVMIYIVNSARESLSGHIQRSFALNQHVLLICDECHHYQSAQNRRIFDFIVSPYASGELYACLGLSATPFGSPNDSILIQSLGPVIYTYDFQSASGDGIISPFSICETSVSFLPSERDLYTILSREILLLLIKIHKAHPEWKELPYSTFMKKIVKEAQSAKMDPSNMYAAYLLKTYERKAVTNLAESRLRCCLALIEALPETERIIVFCERIEQAYSMARLVRRFHANICTIYHSGLSPEARLRNISDFREGRIRVLITCRCLDEGVDVPDATVGIVLSGSAVSRQRIQRLGRILRRADGKISACLYYLYIRESSEDAAFLPGLNSAQCRSLRFDSVEQAFSSDLYEYAASQVIRRAKEAGFSSAQMQELRTCLSEGLPRTDYLMNHDIIHGLHQTAASRHTANYWLAMEKIHDIFFPEK